METYGNAQIDKILHELPLNTKYGGKTKQKICI